MKTRLALLSLLFVTTAAAQTTIGSWRLGENDPSPTNGGALTATLPDVGLLGSFTASVTPTYTNATVAGSGSTWAINMGGGGNSNSLALATTLGVDDNYAVEAWLNVTDSAGLQVVFYNGNTSANGMGLLVNNGRLDMMVGGTTATSNSLPTPTLALNTWVSVAAVREAGATYFYYEGTRYDANVGGHGAATGSFFLGSGGGYGLAGALDNVRAFTFTGAFASSMLTPVPAAVPEPSTSAALAGGLAALALAVWRRRRQATQA